MQMTLHRLKQKWILDFADLTEYAKCYALELYPLFLLAKPNMTLIIDQSKFGKRDPGKPN